MKKISELLHENGNGSFFLAVPAMMWQVLFFWLPLVFLILLSFVTIEPGVRVISFTLAHYQMVFDLMHVVVILRSLFLAWSTASICLLIGYPVAYYVALQVKRFKTLLLFFLTLPFWVNFLVHVYAWFFVLDYQGIINLILLKLGIISQPLYMLNSMFAIGLVMVHCYLPFMILPIYTILQKLDVRLLEASADLGARPNVTLHAVTLPMSLSGIHAGFFLVLVSSFGEYAIPALLGGGKKLFVGSLITNYFLSSQQMSIGSAFTVFSSIVLIVVAALLRLVLSKKMILKGAYR